MMDPSPVDIVLLKAIKEQDEEKIRGNIESAIVLEERVHPVVVKALSALLKELPKRKRKRGRPTASIYELAHLRQGQKIIEACERAPYGRKGAAFDAARRVMKISEATANRRREMYTSHMTQFRKEVSDSELEEFLADVRELVGAPPPVPPIKFDASWPEDMAAQWDKICREWEERNANGERILQRPRFFDPLNIREEGDDY